MNEKSLTERIVEEPKIMGIIPCIQEIERLQKECSEARDCLALAVHHLRGAVPIPATTWQNTWKHHAMQQVENAGTKLQKAVDNIKSTFWDVCKLSQAEASQAEASQAEASQAEARKNPDEYQIAIVRAMDASTVINKSADK
jgi:hypothetical protein